MILKVDAANPMHGALDPQHERQSLGAALAARLFASPTRTPCRLLPERLGCATIGLHRDWRCPAPSAAPCFVPSRNDGNSVR